MSVSAILVKGWNFISYAISIVVYFSLLVALWDLVVFVWDQDEYQCFFRSCSRPQSWKHRTVNNVANWTTFQCVLFDFVLLSLFMLSHSLRIPNIIKRIVPWHLSRGLYVLITSLTIECFICWWVRVPEVFLWKYDLGESSASWWIFLVISVTCWTLLYVECLMMDLSELLGFKQVYYHSNGLGSPLSLKTESLQTLFSHMRHPGFTAFTFLLWFHPFMSLDRLLMALVFTLYMVLRFSVTEEDYHYQRQQIQTKLAELNRA